MEKNKKKTGPLKIHDLLEVNNLQVHYNNGHTTTTAVKGISFNVKKHETLGLVGESGCGKSSTGLAIARLIPGVSGSVKWKGQEILTLSQRNFLPLRKKIQIIFQDPNSSLNPRLSIRKSLTEALELGFPGQKNVWEEQLSLKLESVGMSHDVLSRFPHEFSGGQLQRIGIARALLVEPELIICDEPVSSLDVSIQAQILNLLMDLQEKLGLSYLFISHDLSVIKHISDDVAVMSNGCIREIGTTDSIFNNPQSKYTQTLLQAIPGYHKPDLIEHT